MTIFGPKLCSQSFAVFMKGIAVFMKGIAFYLYQSIIDA
jgi:hypothetical protein